MPKITYITPGGKTIVVENAHGTLMSAAVANHVEGIEGECGGVCSCATCHIHIDPAWMDKVTKTFSCPMPSIGGRRCSEPRQSTSLS
ncbi:MAG: hypothetical protein EBX90_13055 [Betaproteobacteria bacterium]|nr:hypothetical protein [Betaproteobacteria bacterium]